MANRSALTVPGILRSLLFAGNTASASGWADTKPIANYGSADLRSGVAAAVLGELTLGAFREPWLPRTPARPDVHLGACRVTLEYGERVSSQAIGMSLEFVDVSTDSRCPADAQCPWTGTVGIVLNLWLEGADLGEIHLTFTDGGGSAATVDDRFELRLLDVRPGAGGERTLQLNDYEVALQVTDLCSQPDATVGPAQTYA